MARPVQEVAVAPIDSPWLTAKAAAAYLSITVRQFNERAAIMPGFPEAHRRPGLRPLWNRKELDAYLRGYK